MVPDILVAAKAVGNGHPIGIVACRTEIAEAIHAGSPFVSSPAGSPVSSSIGLAVLETIAGEGLQENAAGVGRHMKARLEALAAHHPIIGAVHGRGFYMGVDLVRDHETLEPAPEEAMAICDRLLSLGVLMQPTGDAHNVLKIKPPLCLSHEDADFFVDTLALVLAERDNA